ncbi:MAG TPA: T9SS type A sorting domain-containing protein [Bacteroidales bacterium]|nr:T9SS type A sorting domain-containing protein [Bacteroidales bacterium]HSA44818.1 T9SS type A sorting domain-containing protein [Bacteroidales bacterium]
MKRMRFPGIPLMQTCLIGTYLLTLPVFLTKVVHAQPAGSFEIQLNLGLETYELAFHVPSGYNPQNPAFLIVGMHGGGGSGKGYRSHLLSVAEAWPAVLVCPDNNGNSFNGPGEQLLLKAIDTAMQLYNIDPNRLILNGFSMNGFQTYRLGLQPLYPFYGFIPYNAVIQIPWISQLNLSSNVPACICEGSLDFYLNENIQVYDSLTANGTRAYFNLLPGTGHDLDTAFPAAILRCLQVIDSIQLVSGNAEPGFHNSSTVIFPNPADSWTMIHRPGGSPLGRLTVFDMTGREVSAKCRIAFFPSGYRLDISLLSRGIYILNEMIAGECKTYRLIKQ